MIYDIVEIGHGFWTIQDGPVRMYVMDCGGEALMVDTGYGSGALGELVHSLVQGPVTVINTHCHGDHIGGNKFFEKFYAGEGDIAAIRPACPETAQILPAADGDEITVGDISLQVAAIPGHTPGSIALLDRANRRIFSSDSIALNFPIYMQFPGQDLDKYHKSLEKIAALKDAYDVIWPCHGDLHIDKEAVNRVLSCLDGIMDGSLPEDEAMNSQGKMERAYKKEDVIIFH